jgi:hypothetical protein
LYVRKSFLGSELGQTLLSGEETLRKKYPLKTLPSSEFSRVCKFNIRFENADRDIYIKWFFRKSWLASLKAVFAGSLAACCYKAEMMMAQNGFDVPVTIAIGESWSGPFHSESFSVTIGIENTTRAIDIARQARHFKTHEQIAGFQDLTRNFGITIGKMHANGIVHGDLRFGNVLFKPEGASWRFFFIDNARTQKSMLLHPWLRVKNLVQLNLSTYGLLRRTDRMRFFIEYCNRAGISKKSRKSLLKTVLKKTRRRANIENKIRRALDKTLRENSKYALVKTADCRGVFVKSLWRQKSHIDFLNNLDKIIESGQVLKSSHNCTIFRLKWNGSDMALARYQTKGFINSLRQTIGSSIAKRAWLNAHRARLLKIPAPNILAFIESRKSGLVRSSCFVTEYAEGQKLIDFPCDKNVPITDRQ